MLHNMHRECKESSCFGFGLVLQSMGMCSGGIVVPRVVSEAAWGQDSDAGNSESPLASWMSNRYGQFFPVTNSLRLSES